MKKKKQLYCIELKHQDKHLFAVWLRREMFFRHELGKTSGDISCPEPHCCHQHDHLLAANLPPLSSHLGSLENISWKLHEGGWKEEKSVPEQLLRTLAFWHEAMESILR